MICSSLGSACWLDRGLPAAGPVTWMLFTFGARRARRPARLARAAGMSGNRCRPPRRRTPAPSARSWVMTLPYERHALAPGENADVLGRLADEVFSDVRRTSRP